MKILLLLIVVSCSESGPKVYNDPSGMVVTCLRGDFICEHKLLKTRTCTHSTNDYRGNYQIDCSIYDEYKKLIKDR